MLPNKDFILDLLQQILDIKYHAHVVFISLETIGMPDSQKNETLENFRKGNVNILVATSVGSEGIDVPDCNFIITYNYTGNEASVIQMSGEIPEELDRVYLSYQNFNIVPYT